MKTLLLRPDKAGDALKTLPVLRALRAHFPSDEFHLLASEHNASVFEYEPGYRVHVLGPRWQRGPAKAVGKIAGLDLEFDKIISLLCDPFSEVDALLLSLKGKEKFAASSTLAGPTSYKPPINLLPLPARTPAGRNETVNIAYTVSTAMGVDLSSELGWFRSAPVFAASDELEADRIMGEKRGRWLGFCPFAGTTQRTHPLKRWERFIPKATQDASFDKFFLFGVPSDYSKLEKLRQMSGRERDFELCFPSSFRTLGAYLQRLDGVVAVDSGPLHMARSLGVKSLGILSGGDTARWFPENNEGDMLLKRGILQRFPSVLEMVWAFKRWKPNSVHSTF